VTAEGVPRRPARPGGGLGSGNKLDAVIAAADNELLGYVRANVDPEAALLAMLASDLERRAADPATPSRHDQAAHKAGRGQKRQCRPRFPEGSPRRRHWAAATAAVAAAVIGSCVAVLAVTGSVRLAAEALPPLVGFAVTSGTVIWWLGTGKGHPWVRGLATRPWRDGRDVLITAVRHLPEVFVVMPGEVLLAPNAVELLMNPGDLDSLTNLIDIQLVNSSAAERYRAEIAEHRARLASDDPVTVSVTGDPAVAGGNYRLRRHRQREVSDQAGPSGSPVGDAAAGQELARAGSAGTSVAVLARPAVGPSTLRLVTNGTVTETRLSFARAGRSRDAELRLPEVPEVSRVHAEFTFSEGQWWITSLGRNGLVLNGTLLSGEQVVRPGDSIQWGSQDGAPMSRVEIG
jgi:FHA domain